MTNRGQAPKNALIPPLERTTTAVLIGACLIGVAWVGLMIYTITGWLLHS